MDHLLTCECGLSHRVGRSQAGQQISCECGKELQVPTLRGLSELPLAEEKGVDASQSSAWKGWRAPTLATCSGLLVLSLLYSGYAFLQSFRNDLNYSTEDFIAEGDAAIDTFGPDELSITWTDFQTLGLRNRASPMFHVYNLYSEEQKVKGFAGLGVSALFALLVAGIWWSARFSSKPSADPSS